MKRLLQFVVLILFALLLYAQVSHGSTYFVDNCVVTGNDSNSGTSSTTPWLTVAKVNSISFNPGDTVLFEGGCTWREQLIPKTSGALGSPITFGSYGSGQATLNGSTMVTGWTLSSGNIYTSTISWGPYGYAVWEDGTLLTKVTSGTAGMTAGTFYEIGNDDLRLDAGRHKSGRARHRGIALADQPERRPDFAASAVLHHDQQPEHHQG